MHTDLETNATRIIRLQYMGKRHGGWWLKLIKRRTGEVKILRHHSKQFFDGITIDIAERWTRDQGWRGMYKPM